MNNFQEIRDSYREAVVHFLNRYKEQASEHIIDVMISVMMTRDGKLMGGSFVKAICNNDLKDVIGRCWVAQSARPTSDDYSVPL
jgi:hypothetical protein